MYRALLLLCLLLLLQQLSHLFPVPRDQAKEWEEERNGHNEQIESLREGMSEIKRKVISWGVYYHHFHDSQRLLMLSPG